MTRLTYTGIDSADEGDMWATPRTLLIKLHPGFNDDGEAQHIDVEMVFDVTDLSQGDVIFRKSAYEGPTPVNQYRAEDIDLKTASGLCVELYSVDNPANTSERSFHASVDVGDTQLLAKYRADVRKVDGSETCGSQAALERDGGGLSACGAGFLLNLATQDATKFHAITVQWDLNETPRGTRAVCTSGEGSETSFVERPTELVQYFFMVGKIQSHPASTVGKSRGFYWLSQPNFDPVELGRKLDNIVPKLQAFFKDSQPLFRIFARRNEYKCISGMGVHQGFVFGWNDRSPTDPNGNLEFILHELIHNWPRIGLQDPAGVPTREDYADLWFNEGIADFYALVLPHQMGFESRDDFLHRFNVHISGYYTNPARFMENEEFYKRFSAGFHQIRVPYQRGMMYFLGLACKLRRAGKRSLDELIYIMVKLRRTAQPHGIKVWLSLVAAELGHSAFNDYNRMSDGELIHLPADCMATFLGPDAKCLKLVRNNQEEFYLGFPERCINARNSVVKDLDTESRAAKSGVREGDMITDQHSYLSDAENWDKMFFMKVQRGDSFTDLIWWPRSYEKVESYQVVRT